MREKTHRWSIRPLEGNGARKPINLKEGETFVGRSEDKEIFLPDKSVSREHACILLKDGELTITDLDSVNGVLINEIPRRTAHLQAGDVVTIGKFRFKISDRYEGSDTEPLTNEQDKEASPARKTVLTIAPLPNLKGAQRLSTLYYISSWLSEGLPEEQVISKTLRALLQATKASEIHFYSESRELVNLISEGSDRKPFKVAGFLARHFQSAPEARIFTGEELRYHQKGAGDYDILASPLRPSPLVVGDIPYYLLINPTAWQEFSNHDRIMMQAISQIWSRSNAPNEGIHQLSHEGRLLTTGSINDSLLLGDSGEMRRLRTRISRSADNEAPVMITGETGTGKELVARMIHAGSRRRNQPFIKLNCAAIPSGLIESELFGHTKGAFTDARTDRKGKFELANNGTLFLDEIAEMPLELQSKVLRAVETSEFERVGAESSTSVNIRLIAATHQNLKSMVEEGRFRRDLLFRLDVLRIKTPPLRSHTEDIASLAKHFLQLCSGENGVFKPEISREAIEVLKQHDWPGNVRELRNVMQRCVITTDSPVIGAGFMREVISDSEEDADW